MGRVTYIHHYVLTTLVLDSMFLILFLQLPTLYFSVLMFAHVLDHFVFSTRGISERTKVIVFGYVSFGIVASFWWFKGVAFGIQGPVIEHWGLQWRKVCFLFFLPSSFLVFLHRKLSLFCFTLTNDWYRLGTSISQLEVDWFPSVGVSKGGER